VHLKEFENVYQNTSNEPLFYLIRNNVHSGLLLANILILSESPSLNFRVTCKQSSASPIRFQQ